MQRVCEACGRSYDANSPRSKTCGPACRKARSRGKSAPADVIAQNDEPVVSAGLIESTRAALEAAGRLDTVAGQSALRIAQAMTGRETGAGLAALSKALSASMAEALDGAATRGDSLDELKARREARRAG